MLIGEWDAGAVLASHQEFNGRVKLIDNVKSHYHATHVAGTIIRTGIISHNYYQSLVPGKNSVLSFIYL